MAHVFRFHSDKQNLDGWDSSSKYDSKAINAIEDPSGASASLPITSVPTPFATFELVKSAYESIVSSKELDGNSIYHKLVSHSLDVIEIFFNYDKFRNQFEIIECSKTDLENLLNSDDDTIKSLGSTLSLYMKQDAKAFNFDKLSSFFFLNNIKGNKELNIIGGTSPTSLCVASTNDLSSMELYLSNDHKAFLNSDFMPLFKRNPEFIKYMWSLVKSEGFSNGSFDVIVKYLNLTFEKVSDEKFKAELREVNEKTYNELYEPIKIGNTTLMFAENILISKKKVDIRTIGEVSDFRIKSDKYKEGVIPLVLPNSKFNEPNMHYVSGKWNVNDCAPLFDEESNLEKRYLPFDGTQYPYLTVDDLFQPQIIKVPYPINETDFFLAGLNSTDYSYLLPLKTEIFKYFTVDEIVNGINGVPLLELKDYNGSIEAKLNIPIQKNKFITFERKYNSKGEYQKSENIGVVDECKVDLFIYPFIHLPISEKEKTNNYIYLIDGDTSTLKRSLVCSLKLYNDNSLTPLAVDPIDRAKKESGYKTNYYILESDYDYIELSYGDSKSIVIPRFKKANKGGDSYEFAIDFGTSNTHIEYRVNGSKQIQSFDITKSEKQVVSLHDSNSEKIAQLFFGINLDGFNTSHEHEFIPYCIGDNSMFKFPLRTAVSTLDNVERKLKVAKPLADYNIDFIYLKDDQRKHNKNIFNLKWSEDESVAAESFIQELLLLIRNKVLVNGGDLSKTKIVWFYPVSMPRHMQSNLSKIWNKYISQYISEECKQQAITESLAPYYYYKFKEGVCSHNRPVALIDIGGGTTDFVIYKDDKPVVLSSVRFAGNDLYGDFCGADIEFNGFVNRFKPEFDNILFEQDNKDIPSCLLNIATNAYENSSIELISFYFSLEKNKEITDKGLDVSFTKMLAKDSKMRIVLLLFLTAELYYLAKLFKKNNIHQAPEKLIFSGTASLLNKLISPNLQVLNEYSSIIFNKVLNDDSNIEFVINDKPKQVTCKGGLLNEVKEFDASKIIQFVTGSNTIDSSTNKFKFSDLNGVESEIEKEYISLINLFFDIDNDFSYLDNFNISQNNFNEYKRILLSNSKNDIYTMIKSREKELNGQKDPEIRDALFLFPVSGGLNRLAYYISKE